MTTNVFWSRSLLILGLAGMLLGAVDPLEGSMVILPATALAALGALLAKSRARRLLYGSLALVAIGVAAMFALSAWGGVGGRSGHSFGWLIVVSPYPAGWLLGLVGAIHALIESFKHHPTHTPAAT